MRKPAIDSDSEDKGLPPEGLWVSPDGVRTSVIEHLIEIQHHPETFGLNARDVKGASIQDLHGIAVKLILSGWTRFRFLSGVWNFEVDSVKARRPLVEDILMTHQAFHLERVVISRAVPKRDYQGSVAQFYDQSMFRHYELGRAARSTWLKFGYTCRKALGIKPFKKTPPAKKRLLTACVMKKGRLA